MKKRLISLLAAAALLVAAIPAPALAAEGEVTAPAASTVQPAETPAEQPATEPAAVVNTPAAEDAPVVLADGPVLTADDLKAAVANAEDGKETTVTLGADIELAEMLTVPAEKKIVLDLNGHKVTVPPAVNGRSLYAVENYGTLTICDTSAAQSGVIASRGVQNYGTAYLHSGAIQCIDSNGGGAAMWNEGHFEMDGGKLEFTGEKQGDKAGSPLTMEGSSTGVVSGGEIISPYTCVFVQSFADLELKNITLTSSTDYWMTVKVMGMSTCSMDNVTINTSNGGCVEVSGGTLNLKNCTFTQTNQGNPAWNSCALAVSNKGTVNVDSGSYTGTIAAAYIYTSGGTFNLKGGTFIGEKSVLRADYEEKNDGRAFAINVSGGNYQGTMAINDKATLTVSGGTFDNKLDEKYLAEGFTLKQNADGTFTTVKDMTGTGTETDPYVISTLEQLELFRDEVNTGESEGKYYTLGANIDLSTVENWVPIGTSGNPFKGTFDGNGHTISNMKIVRGKTNEEQNNRIGFFGVCAGNALLTNFTLVDPSVSGYGNVGAVLGEAAKGSTVKVNEVDVTGTVTVEAMRNVGGVVGNGNCTITNCSVSGTVKIGSDGWAGGILGNGNSAISGCSVNGTLSISGDWYIGGIAGYGYCKISDCHVDGMDKALSVIDNIGGYTGGIVGFMGEGNCVTENCTVKNITVTGAYNGIGGVNGILHYGNTIKNCDVENVVVWQTTDPEESDNGRIYVGAFAGTYLDNDGKNIPTVESCTFFGELYSGVAKNNVLEASRAVGSLWYGANPPANVNLKECMICTVVAGEGRYSNLADALNAAGPDDVITILTDITENVVIPEGKTVTLDLAGHKITNVSDHTIVNNGTLTIVDSGKTGTVDNVTHGKAAIFNNGTMTIQGGTYTRSLETQDGVDDGTDNSWYTVVNDGTMTINGGTFTTADGQPENLGNRSSLVRNGADGDANEGVSLTITGGKFTSGANIIKNEPGSVIEAITGGEFTMDNSKIAWAGSNNLLQSYGTIKSITGGTFKALGDGVAIDGDKTYYRHGIAVYGDGKIEEIGGSVTLEMEGGQNRLIRVDDNGKVNVTGGSYELTEPANSTNQAFFTPDGNGALAVSGGTFSNDPTVYLTPDSQVVKNPDGTFGVQDKPAVTPTPKPEEPWTPNPTPTPTPVPAPTATPKPAATARPKPTATPAPTEAPAEATPTPEPAEPTPTPAPTEAPAEPAGTDAEGGLPVVPIAIGGIALVLLILVLVLRKLLGKKDEDERGY